MVEDITWRCYKKTESCIVQVIHKILMEDALQVNHLRLFLM